MQRLLVQRSCRQRRKTAAPGSQPPGPGRSNRAGYCDSSGLLTGSWAGRHCPAPAPDPRHRGLGGPRRPRRRGAAAVAAAPAAGSRASRRGALKEGAVPGTRRLRAGCVGGGPAAGGRPGAADLRAQCSPEGTAGTAAVTRAAHAPAPCHAPASHHRRRRLPSPASPPPPRAAPPPSNRPPCRNADSRRSACAGLVCGTMCPAPFTVAKVRLGSSWSA
jgi:hypothetical protein